MHKIHLRYKNQTPRERTWTIHLISIEKVVKGLVLVIVGVKLLTFLGKDVHEWAVDFVARHRFAVLDRFLGPLLEKLVGVGDRQLKQFSVAAFAYAGILFVEGIGLWLQKRWAEYLTAIATALFIPFELYEIYEKLTWVRAGALAINIFIVWYLFTRLKDEKAEPSHTTFVKICGITNLDDARHAVAAGADALGFNFYGKSKRFILPERAAAIAGSIGAKASKIGVFVNSPVHDIVDAVEIVGLDAVQLHGDETAEFVDELRRELPDEFQIIRCVRAFGEAASFGAADALLFDAPNDGEFGGTGVRADWKDARRLTHSGVVVYLAGGLDPDNVSRAIAEVHPFAVDACCALERAPGLKDHAKVERFINAAKGIV